MSNINGANMDNLRSAGITSPTSHVISFKQHSFYGGDLAILHNPNATMKELTWRGTVSRYWNGCAALNGIAQVYEDLNQLDLAFDNYNRALQLYEKIGNELGKSYSLGFKPASTSHDGAHHRIEVRVRDGSMHVTQSREGYNAR